MSDALISVPVTVTDGDGEQQEAELLLCCGDGTQPGLFLAFVVHAHLHLQCAACGTSYCPGGACARLPAACEVCGCTERTACPGGCGWDAGFAAHGRAVCTTSRCLAQASGLVLP